MSTTKQDLLIYGKEYKLWREGKYLGKATWTEDNNIGDSFLKAVITTTGEMGYEVYWADEWEMTFEKDFPAA